MPQFSTSKKSLNATGPRAKHERKYDHLDFRPHPGFSVYGGTHVKTTKTNRIVVGMPSFQNGQDLVAGGEVSIFSVDRDGVLYNRETVITGELGNNIEDAGLVIDTYSDGNNFTIAASYEDSNDTLGRIWVGYYTVSGETNTLVRSFTITNPDTSGTSGVFSSSDNFARSAIALIDHEHLVVGITNYDVDYSSTGFQGRSYIYRKNSVSQAWQVIRTLNSAAGRGGYGSIGSISGRKIGTDTRFTIGNWTYDSGDGGNPSDGEFLEYNIVNPGTTTTLIRNIQSSGGANFGRGVLVTDDYTIISAPGGEAANGDDGAIYVYDNDPWQLRFILHTPLIDFPFNGGNGGVSNFGLDGRRLAVDNDILYVCSANADSVGGTGQTLGAIAKYDLITGQFIDYYHVPQRFPYNSYIQNFSVYEGRAFIVGGQDYYENLNDSLGLGIYVIDDLVKPSTFWDSFSSVKALEQVSKKGEFGQYTNEIYLSPISGFYGGQPSPDLIRTNPNGIGISDMSYDLDLSNDYLTIEVITASSEFTRWQCVLYLEHATDPTKDLSMHIQPNSGAPSGGCGFRAGGTENGTNWITISHTEYAWKHWGITFQKQVNNNFLILNNGSTFYGSDSNVYIDNAQNYVKAHLFRDPNEPANYLSGRVVQVKISQAAPYGAPTSSTGVGPSYTNPVTNEDRIPPGFNTRLYWEAPTTRY